MCDRKTGLTLAERPRDENGMEAFDDLFSSPEKDVHEGAVNGTNRRNHAESDEEQDMEIDDGMLRATHHLLQYSLTCPYRVANGSSYDYEAAASKSPVVAARPIPYQDAPPIASTPKSASRTYLFA